MKLAVSGKLRAVYWILVRNISLSRCNFEDILSSFRLSLGERRGKNEKKKISDFNSVSKMQKVTSWREEEKEIIAQNDLMRRKFAKIRVDSSYRFQLRPRGKISHRNGMAKSSRTRNSSCDDLAGELTLFPLQSVKY